ncbi:hypothetical protein SSTU70S_03777 [Stutzerimonas stutzeri]
MATWIFLLCLRNLRLALVTIRAMTGRMATITRVSFQFMYSSERNRKTTVMPSRITTLMASVAAPVTMVTLKVIREIRCPELWLSK